MPRPKIIFSFLFSLVLLLSCKTEEPVDSIPALQEGQTLKYNNEYLKIVDEDSEKDRPVRLINAEAPLRLGQLNYTLNDDESVKIHTFKKGFTSIHLSEKGALILLRDMNNTSFSFFICHEDVLSDISGSYPLSDSEKKSSSYVELTTYKKGDTLNFKTDAGKLYLTQFNPRSGKVELHIEGQLKNIKTGAQEPLQLELNVNIESVTSSVVKRGS